MSAIRRFVVLLCLLLPLIGRAVFFEDSRSSSSPSNYWGATLHSFDVSVSVVSKTPISGGIRYVLSYDISATSDSVDLQLASSPTAVRNSGNRIRMVTSTTAASESETGTFQVDVVSGARKYLLSFGSIFVGTSFQDRVFVSDPLEGSKAYRRLQFMVTNPGARRLPVAVWGVGGDGIAFTDALSVSTIVSADPGATVAVTHYTEVGGVDSEGYSVFSAGVIDYDGSRMVYPEGATTTSYLRVDGSWAFCFIGVNPLDGSVTPTKEGVTGDLVESLGFANGSGAAMSSVVAPITATPGRVADGSTGPATGKEITDSANAQIAQAHSDAAALQKSVDSVGSKIDNLASKTGTGTGTGGMTKADVDGATATGQSTANSDAQGKANNMDGQFGEASTKGENAVAGVRTGVLGQAAMAFGTGSAKITTGHAAPGSQKTTFTGNSLMDGIQAEGGGGMDANPFTNVLGWILPPEEITGWALFARQCQLWLAVAAFFVWTVGQVMEAAKTIQQTPPLQLGPGTQIVLRTSVLGNSVGVPAAAIMWGVLAVLWTTALVGLPVAIVAVFIDAAGAGPMSLATMLSDAVSAMQGTASATSASSGGSKLGTALGYVEMWCPLATYVAIFGNTLILRFTALVQIMLGSVVRTLLSII